MDEDLSFGSLGKEVWYLFVSWVASASETALLMSMESSSGEREIQPEPGAEGSLDILIGKGGKVLMDEGEGGESIEEDRVAYHNIQALDTMQ